MESEQTGIKQKNNGGPLPRSYSPRQSLRRRDGVRTKGNPLVLTSCRPPCGDGCVRPPVPKAKLWLEQAGSEHRASARGTGGDSGVWKGASKGGNAPHNRPLSPARRAQERDRDRTDRNKNRKVQVLPHLHRHKAALFIPCLLPRFLRRQARPARFPAGLPTGRAVLYVSHRPT